MTEPKVSLSMRTGAGVKEDHFTPTAGGEVAIEFDPAAVKVSADYSSADKLVLRFEGNTNLRVVGLPNASVSGGAKLQGDGWTAATGLEWKINSSVSARVDYEYSNSAQSALATVKIRFP